MRLSQYLAHAGVASRRQAEELILAGKVKVNGVMVKELGSKIDPKNDRVEFNGQAVSGETKLYILLNKPAGYLSSVSDPYQRPVVIDLVSQVNERLYPVGRLDFDTEGLLLLTNDGYFNNLMIHPRYKIEKKYHARVRGKVGLDKIRMLEKGILLEDGVTSPAQVQLLESRADESLLEIVIHEGRKRQIKRMCAAIGHPVIALKRTAFGFLNLRGIARGEYRLLRPSEVKQLIKLAKGQL